MPFHNRAERWSVIVAHRRAGKTVACVNELIKGALTCQKQRPRFAYIAPLLKQAKTVAWDYAKEYGLVVPGSKAHESELRVDFPNDGQVRLYGADNPDTLRGVYLDGVILDEAADMSPRMFTEVIRPALSDRGGWCVWIGTPKGQNDFFDLYERSRDEDDWFSLMLRASETGIIDPKELIDARKSMTRDQYDQEYECSFQAAIVGAYYGREMDEAEKAGRIVENLYDPTMEVHTAWDIGLNDQTVITFWQQKAFDIRIVDCYAANGFGLDHYAKILDQRGYKYGRHVWPHDGGNGDWSAVGGRSRVETARELGLDVEVLPKGGIEDGINAVRRIMPKVWFDRKTCAELLKALRQYRKQWDDVRKCFYERPLHDWTSDYADSFRYLASAVEEPTADAAYTPKRSFKWVV
jgi:phage terminase large subunit